MTYWRYIPISSGISRLLASTNCTTGSIYINEPSDSHRHVLCLRVDRGGNDLRGEHELLALMIYFPQTVARPGQTYRGTSTSQAVILHRAAAIGIAVVSLLSGNANSFCCQSMVSPKTCLHRQSEYDLWYQTCQVASTLHDDLYAWCCYRSSCRVRGILRQRLWVGYLTVSASQEVNVTSIGQAILASSCRSCGRFPTTAVMRQPKWIRPSITCANSRHEYIVC